MHTRTYMRAHVHRYTLKRKKEREKGEEEATTKTPGEHPSLSGASSEEFLPFSLQDYGIHGNWELRSTLRGHKASNTRWRFPFLWTRVHPAASICRGKTFHETLTVGISGQSGQTVKAGISPRGIYCTG